MSKILIVDDNPDILHLMQLLFASRGFEVTGTLKGEETFELVNTLQPSLIFLDIHLSGMDGRDISRQLKTTQETKHIPVILFSANIIKGSTLADSLADEFIAKPFDIHELMLKVNKFISTAGDTESMTA
jgi:CheY-like chemotaxis protein